MIYYTSDLHIGHANILKHCNRPFSNVDEMNEALIENWNRRLCHNDTVFVLGDLFFRNALPASHYLERMKGKKHLIIGNHDRGWMKQTDVMRYFEDISLMREVVDRGRKLTLCHYPMLAWNGCGKGAYHIYGHVHSNLDHGYGSILAAMPHALNACVDVNHFQPVTFEELQINNNRIRQQEIWQVC